MRLSNAQGLHLGQDAAPDRSRNVRPFIQPSVFGRVSRADSTNPALCHEAMSGKTLLPEDLRKEADDF
ncbi:hypothetical protein [Mesorhizobium sp.]|uniref:hypothetical protein n=1 Tax=Mesorhizobium sp. TaxID=1871066 RepID=UPI001200DB65|nr:hypothetical protein [Mesorhizobium sp.]TIL65531.1 MAG: hypothetical protein E5Y77_21850 [Mesorhizobium sp.]